MLPMSNYWKIPGIPHKGWRLIKVIDLGEESYSLSSNNYETCMMCGHEDIRYVHLVSHTDVPNEFRVGCICAEKMTGDYVNPKQQETRLRNRATRRQNWANLNWKWSRKGNLYIKKDEHILTIFRDKKTKKFKCRIDDEFGSVHHPTIADAKIALFSKMEERKDKGCW